ncbi:M43 family zinc metalloprotease [Algoriphagus sp. oki45]|uniref:M43 family zinc metalloprotease n=1 Tax=Algoriphagus sp. oki45 TaxID=3067294 RepID=UPI0030C6B8D8
MRIGFQLLRISSFFLFGFLMATTSFSQKFELKAIEPFPSSSSQAHTHSEKCAHGILERQMEKDMGYFGSKAFLEQWFEQKITERRNAPQLFRIQEEIRKIPVVVHVIHTGTDIGVGTNISDQQIFEQIRILNEDFRRLNADANRTPAEFLPVAADSKIEFVLAKQDPNGLPTSGIVRLQGPQTTYNPNDATLIGQLSQWNPEEYMNIWVVPLVSPFIGYASFPISDLPGLNFPPTSALTDGVTIDYRFFGIGGSAISFSRGRTATHEVGHYLGLRHIWGDGGCGVDDFVSDTPEQDNSNNICNDNPSRISCGSNDMIQNYMDYTPDACMNLFTLGQVERFNVVLANSPRRVSLVNNRATIDPVLPALDLAILRVIEPNVAICDLNVEPRLEIANAGQNTITSARIEVKRNGILLESRVFSLNLQTSGIATVSFNSVTIPATGSNLFEFEIKQVNGQQDGKAENNFASTNPVIQGEIDLPYVYNISSFPGDWIVTNPDDSFTWTKTNVNLSGANEEVLFVRNYEYDATGQLDYFTSPTIDLRKYPNAQVVFEVAHAPYNQAGFQDELIVAISSDCGDNYDLVNSNYRKSGVRLQTSTPTLDEFTPTSPNSFRTEIVNLSKYRDLEKVRVGIINRNSFGNNVYIRNIRILPQEEFKYEVQIIDLLSPSPINNGETESEEILVKNTGNLPVSGFIFSRSTNSGGSQNFIASGTTLIPDQEIILELNNSSIAGQNRLQYQLREPNFDQNAQNYPLFVRFNQTNSARQEVPWRQNFNTSSELAPWVTINPERGNPAWRVNTNSGGTGSNNLVILENGSKELSYWLGSPIFDLSVSTQASVFFDLAAGQVDPNTSLSVLASDNGGVTYTEVWRESGSNLSTVDVGAANPNSPNDFQRKYVNLTDFAGSGKTNVRISFVLDVQGENDPPVYLDNVELFLSANPDPVIPGEGSSVLYPNPATDYFNIAFNLPRRESVRITIISATGSVVQNISYPSTLNQTYTFSRELFAPGLYIIRITSDSIQEIKRLVIN